VRHSLDPTDWRFSDGGFVSVFRQAPASPAARSLFANKDTRQSWKVAYPLREVLFLVVCATIANCDDCDEIVDWGEANLAFLSQTPSLDYFGTGSPSCYRKLDHQLAKGSALDIPSA
jgi:hypothetical protein